VSAGIVFVTPSTGQRCDVGAFPGVELRRLTRFAFRIAHGDLACTALDVRARPPPNVLASLFAMRSEIVAAGATERNARMRSKMPFAKFTS
jgi:hypothetical protein